MKGMERVVMGEGGGADQVQGDGLIGGCECQILTHTHPSHSAFMDQLRLVPMIQLEHI